MDGSVHNRTNLKKVTQAYFCQEKRASPWSREGVWRSVHRFSTQPHKIMFGCRHRWFNTNRSELIVTQAYFSQEKRASPWSREGVRRSVHRFSTQPHKICLVVDMDGSVHNRTNLAKVTLVPEVSTPILSTQPRKICFGCLEVSTPIQYTTAQDMFGCRHRWFNTQLQLTYSYSAVL